MKVVSKRTKLGEISCGEVFRFVDAILYKSIYMAVLNPDNKSVNGQLFAVDIRTGFIHTELDFKQSSTALVDIVDGCFVEGYADND